MEILHFNDFLLISVVTQLKFTILIIQEFSPAVGGTGQQVVEALVILHQIGEDMFHHPGLFLLLFLLVFLIVFLIVFLLFLCQALELQPLHEVRIVCQCLGAVVRQSVVCHFFSQDVASKLFPHKGAAGLLQRQHLVETEDIQPHVHAVGQIFRNHLMHIEIISNDIFIGTERDFPIPEQFSKRVLANRLPGLACYLFDTDISDNHVRLIHLLIHA